MQHNTTAWERRALSTAYETPETNEDFRLECIRELAERGIVVEQNRVVRETRATVVA